MKVLSIISSGYEQGGAETAMKIYTDALKAEGHETITISSNSRPDLPHFSDYEFNTIPQRGLKAILYALFNPSAYMTVRRVLRAHKPDVIILNTMQQVTPSVLFLLKRYPTIQFVHGPEAFTTSLLAWHMSKTNFKYGDYSLNSLTFTGRLKYVYLRFVLGTIYKWGFHNVDRFIVLSEFMQSLLRRDGIARPISRITCGFDLFDFAGVERPQPPVIGYAGRLETFKGVGDLVDAMAFVLQKQRDAKLVIVGEGSYTSRLKEKVASLGISNAVKFKGHVSQPELYAAYGMMSVFVMPSRWPEAFGKVGIEAMSVGTPVVATDVGGISEWLHDGRNGTLVRPLDPRALAEGILHVIQNPRRRKMMAKQARRTSEAYTNEVYVRDLLNVIKETVG